MIDRCPDDRQAPKSRSLPPLANPCRLVFRARPLPVPSVPKSVPAVPKKRAVRAGRAANPALSIARSMPSRLSPLPGPTSGGWKVSSQAAQKLGAPTCCRSATVSGDVEGGRSLRDRTWTPCESAGPSLRSSKTPTDQFRHTTICLSTRSGALYDSGAACYHLWASWRMDRSAITGVVCQETTNR